MKPSRLSIHKMARDVSLHHLLLLLFRLRGVTMLQEDKNAKQYGTYSHPSFMSSSGWFVFLLQASVLGDKADWNTLGIHGLLRVIRDKGMNALELPRSSLNARLCLQWPVCFGHHDLEEVVVLIEINKLSLCKLQESVFKWSRHRVKYRTNNRGLMAFRQIVKKLNKQVNTLKALQ